MPSSPTLHDTYKHGSLAPHRGLHSHPQHSRDTLCPEHTSSVQIKEPTAQHGWDALQPTQAEAAHSATSRLQKESLKAWGVRGLQGTPQPIAAPAPSPGGCAARCPHIITISAPFAAGGAQAPPWGCFRWAAREQGEREHCVPSRCVYLYPSPTQDPFVTARSTHRQGCQLGGMLQVFDMEILAVGMDVPR